MKPNSRRDFLRSTSIAVLTPFVADTALAKPHTTAKEPHTKPHYQFFNATEVAFIEAAVARLIPPDETGPGAIEAGVPSYIDKQLAAAWGAGERLYRGGPWHQGTASQGYQLAFTPAELFRTALRAIDANLHKDGGRAFHEMTPENQDAYLSSLEKDKTDLDGVPSNVFFESLWEMTLEGYFSDPVYGGNKDMLAWEMIGFPGAYANYYNLVDRHGMNFERRPMSLAEGEPMHMHDIPAYVPAPAPTHTSK